MNTTPLRELLPIASPLLALGVNCLAQILFFRITKRPLLLLSVAVGFAGGLLTLVVIELVVVSRFGLDSESTLRIPFISLPIYFCLSYGYFHFVNIGEASIRLRIFDELFVHPQGIPMDELLSRYNDMSVFQMRLTRLVEQGDLVDRQGRYYIGQKRFEIAARILFALKHFVLGRSYSEK